MASNELRVPVGIAGAAVDAGRAGRPGRRDATLTLDWRSTFAAGTPGGAVLEVSGAANLAVPLGAGADLHVRAGAPAGTYTFAVRATNASWAERRRRTR